MNNGIPPCRPPGHKVETYETNPEPNKSAQEYRREIEDIDNKIKQIEAGHVQYPSNPNFEKARQINNLKDQQKIAESNLLTVTQQGYKK